MKKTINIFVMSAIILLIQNAGMAQTDNNSSSDGSQLIISEKVKVLPSPNTILTDKKYDKKIYFALDKDGNVIQKSDKNGNLTNKEGSSENNSDKIIIHFIDPNNKKDEKTITTVYE